MGESGLPKNDQSRWSKLTSDRWSSESPRASSSRSQAIPLGAAEITSEDGRRLISAPNSPGTPRTLSAPLIIRRPHQRGAGKVHLHKSADRVEEVLPATHYIDLGVNSASSSSTATVKSVVGEPSYLWHDHMTDAEFQWGDAIGLALEEARLRSLPNIERRQRARCLYQRLRHLQIRPVPDADEELISWIIEVQSKHGIALEEARLRKLSSAERQHHARFLYQRLRHLQPKPVPAADEEVISWIIEIHCKHCHLLREMRQSETLRPESPCIPSECVVVRNSPRRQHVVQIGRVSATVTADVGIDMSKALAAKPFTEWVDRISKESRIEIRKIHFQSVDMFRSGVGFIKFKAGAKVDTKDVPGIVFMRGGSVAILVILECDGRQFTLLVRQPRVPVSCGNLAEIPAGKLDGNGNFAGVAAKEMKEETGIELKENDLIDMTHLAFRNTYTGVFPSCEASDEFNRIFLFRKSIAAQELRDLDGKLTGVHSEMIKLQIVPLDALWRKSPDAKALAALCLYQKLNDAGLLPEVIPQHAKREIHIPTIINQAIMKDEAVCLQLSKEFLQEETKVKPVEVIKEVPCRDFEKKIKEVDVPVYEFREIQEPIPAITIKEDIREVAKHHLVECLKEVPSPEKGLRRVEKMVGLPVTELATETTEIDLVQIHENIIETPEKIIVELVKEVPKLIIEVVEKRVPKYIYEVVEVEQEVVHYLLEEEVEYVEQVQRIERIKEVIVPVATLIDKDVPKHEIHVKQRTVEYGVPLRQEVAVSDPSVEDVELVTLMPQIRVEKIEKIFPRPVIQKEEEIEDVCCRAVHEIPKEVQHTIDVETVTQWVRVPLAELEKAIYVATNAIEDAPQVGERAEHLQTRLDGAEEEADQEDLAEHVSSLVEAPDVSDEDESLAIDCITNICEVSVGVREAWEILVAKVLLNQKRAPSLKVVKAALAKSHSSQSGCVACIRIHTDEDNIDFQSLSFSETTQDDTGAESASDGALFRFEQIHRSIDDALEFGRCKRK